MVNQVVTTVGNYGDDAISGLLNGETLTINGGSVTIDAEYTHDTTLSDFIIS